MLGTNALTGGKKMSTYTGFCQETDGTGTIWIGWVEAGSLEEARSRIKEECASDWSYGLEDVHVLGIAEGAVEVLYWSDLNE